MMRCSFINKFALQNSSSIDKGEVFSDWAAKFLLLLATSVSYMFKHIITRTDKLDFRINPGASEKPCKYNDYSLNRLHQCCLSLAT